MKNLIPASVAELAKFTDPESCRYALGGVHLEIKDGQYEAAATDTRTLAIVTGKCVEIDGTRSKLSLDSPDKNKKLAEEQPELTCVIPARDLRFAAQSAKKLPKETRCFGVLANCESATLVVDAKRSLDVPLVDGKFPRYRDVIPSGDPVASFTVDAEYLARLLTAARQFGSSNAVEVKVYPNHMLAIEPAIQADAKFLGLLMCLAPAPDTKRQ